LHPLWTWVVSTFHFYPSRWFAWVIDVKMN
jgi:hypothetical protein